MSGLFEDFDDIADLAEGLDDPVPGARIMAVIDLTDSADRLFKVLEVIR